MINLHTPAQGFDFKSFISNLSTSAGVYKMIGSVGQVLYVGKAKNLKNRLTSYLHQFNIDVKITALLNNTSNIDIFLTQNETEALLLEQNFIKLFKPKFNVLLKDDKSYPYLYLSNDPLYPFLIFKRKNNTKQDKGNFFGPYPTAKIVNESLNLIQKVLKLRSCKDHVFNNRSRPCLLYQIKRCSAPCVKYISPQEYKTDVDHAALFLSGKTTELTASLRHKMYDYAKNLDFEKAAYYRDNLVKLQLLHRQQNATNKQKVDIDICIMLVAHRTIFYVLFIRNGAIVGDKKFLPKNGGSLHNEELFSSLLAQFYINLPYNISCPTAIILNSKIKDKTSLTQAIQKNNNYLPKISYTTRGQKNKWFVMATENAQNALDTLDKKQEKLHASFSGLQQFLGLLKAIKRIECFDVSHISGLYTVASCVSFCHTGKDTNNYRSFNIKTATNDDYTAIKEGVRRHYKNLTPTSLPSLIIIDGGQGQLNKAAEALKELNLLDIPLLAIAKGLGRKNGTETLHFLSDLKNKSNKICVLSMPQTACGILLQQIRDEAHRFAIKMHRNKRSKKLTQSQLQEIPGVGYKKNKLLLEYFGSYQKISQASLADLIHIQGISANLAHSIYNAVHK